MTKMLELLSKVILKTALSGANAASSWHMYQPSLPSLLM